MGGVNETLLPLTPVTFTTCVNGRDPNHSDQLPPWITEVAAQLMNMIMPADRPDGVEFRLTVDEPRFAPPLMPTLVNEAELATSQPPLPMLSEKPLVKLMIVVGLPLPSTDPRSVTLLFVSEMSPLRLNV